MSKATIYALTLLCALSLPACTAEVEDPGSLPDVDVQGGELPDIDINAAEVRITTDTQTVRVPSIEINP